MRSIGKVEGLHLLGNGISYRYRKLCLAVTEGLVVEHRLQRNDGRSVVRNLDSDTVRQCDDSHSACSKSHGYLPVEILDCGHAHTGRRNHLVKSHSRSYHRCHPVHLDPVILKGSPDTVVIDVQLLLAHLMLSFRIILQKIKRRELETLQLLTVIYPWKLLRNLFSKVITHNDFHLSGWIHDRLCMNIFRFHDRNRNSRDLVIQQFKRLHILRLGNWLHILFSQTGSIIFRFFQFSFSINSRFLSLTDGCKPAGKSSACKQHPRHGQGNQYEGHGSSADKIIKPCDDSVACIAAQSPSEADIRTERHGHERQYKRSQESTAYRNESRSEQAYMPVPEEKPVCYSTHKENEGKASKSETS